MTARELGMAGIEARAALSAELVAARRRFRRGRWCASAVSHCRSPQLSRAGSLEPTA